MVIQTSGIKRLFEVHRLHQNNIREGCDGEHFGQNCCMPSSEVVSYNKEQSLNMSCGVNSVGVEWVTS